MSVRDRTQAVCNLHKAPMAVSPIHEAGRNRLLSLLPEADRERVLGCMHRVSGNFGDIVFRPGEPIAFIDFPLAAVISIVVAMEEGGVVEAGTVGNEGMSGLSLLLGAERSPNKAFYQVPGEAMRMPVQAFTDEFGRHGAFENVLRRYAQGYLNQVSQSAACNRLHPVDQRLCRWILMSQDRVGSERFKLTQEVLGEMLGVRRASVSVVA